MPDPLRTLCGEAANWHGEDREQRRGEAGDAAQSVEASRRGLVGHGRVVAQDNTDSPTGVSQKL
ncbi:hypothetical protein [Actinoplanes cyaneus]|uniref:hypothetical protein n=1 Tax=Actinoplanes cyaneus TaxID=52696 RepID=UPI0019432F26|nr:hypothetical protein [Actinoplanes cyaneus]